MLDHERHARDDDIPDEVINFSVEGGEVLVEIMEIKDLVICQSGQTSLVRGKAYKRGSLLKAEICIRCENLVGQVLVYDVLKLS